LTGSANVLFREPSGRRGIVHVELLVSCEAGGHFVSPVADNDGLHGSLVSSMTRGLLSSASRQTWRAMLS